MVKVMFRKTILILMALTILLPVLACNANEKVANQKLDSVLNQLAQADNRGEAQSFAAGVGLKLKDDKVQVSVLFIPNQVEIAEKAVTNIGGELNAKGARGFDAFVPISRLEALADEKSIIRIEQPIPFEPEGRTMNGQRCVYEGADLFNSK